VFGRKSNNVNKSYKDKYTKYDYRNNIKDRIIPVKYSLESGHLISEKSLINLLLKDKNVYNKLKEQFSYLDFYNEDNRKIAEVIYRKYEESEVLDMEEIFSELDENISDKLKNIINLSLIVDNKEKAVEDYIEKINYYKLRIKRDKLKQDIKQLSDKKDKSKGEVEKLKALFIEFTHLDKELKINH